MLPNTVKMNHMAPIAENSQPLRKSIISIIALFIALAMNIMCLMYII